VKDECRSTSEKLLKLKFAKPGENRNSSLIFLLIVNSKQKTAALPVFTVYRMQVLKMYENRCCCVLDSISSTHTALVYFQASNSDLHTKHATDCKVLYADYTRYTACTTKQTNRS